MDCERRSDEVAEQRGQQRPAALGPSNRVGFQLKEIIAQRNVPQDTHPLPEIDIVIGFGKPTPLGIIRIPVQYRRYIESTSDL